jgi:hypothetical protein
MGRNALGRVRAPQMEGSTRRALRRVRLGGAGIAGVAVASFLVAACGQGGTGAAGSTTQKAVPTTSSLVGHTTTTLPVTTTTTDPTTTTEPATPVGDFTAVPIVAAGGSTSTVFVLGKVPCKAGSCAELWSGQGTNFERVTAPPNAASVSWLVFANALDGYAVVDEYGSGDVAPYATSDGGKTWQRVTIGQGLGTYAVAESDGEFYALLTTCTSTTPCAGGYRLGRSAAGSSTWTSVPLPGTAALDPTKSPAELGAAGPDVWVDYATPSRYSFPTLVESAGGVAPFTVLEGATLSGGEGVCSLDPMAGGDIWALCPQGMTEDWEHSSDGGQHFTTFWAPFQTGGITFDPVNGTTAYRYTGLGGGTDGNACPCVYPRILQMTSDGGKTFTTLPSLPSEYDVETLLFTGGGTVDGYFVGYFIGNADDNGPEPAALFSTVNGGESWSKAAFPAA